MGTGADGVGATAAATTTGGGATTYGAAPAGAAALLPPGAVTPADAAALPAPEPPCSTPWVWLLWLRPLPPSSPEELT